MRSLYFLFILLSWQNCDVRPGSHLIAVAAPRSKPALVARHTVVIVFGWDEGLAADGLVAAVTHEAVLVPRGSAVLQQLGSCERGETEMFVILIF